MPEKMEKYEEERVFGIDLGTTFSSIAYVNDYGSPKIVANAEGHHTTPSVICLDGDRVAVGLPALEMARDYPESIVSYVKRSINVSGFRFENAGRFYSAEELSSFILRKLVQDAEAKVGHRIRNVVITCPAYFGVNERESIRVAGDIAGLSVRQIINEPTAAAIAYGAAEMAEPKKIVVYDLGGGTFDITMIDIRPKSIKVIGTGGDPRLGGKDWNDRMIHYVAKRFYEETGLDPQLEDILEDYATYWELNSQCEQAKKALGKAGKAEVRFSWLGRDYCVEVTADAFAEMTRDLIGKTLDLTSGMLKAARKKGYSKFDEIILVGGSSYLPQVTKGIVERFGITPRLYHPEEAIARGAAIFGWKLFLRDRLVERIAAQVDLEMDLGELADNLEKVARKANTGKPNLNDLSDELTLSLDSAWDPSEKAARQREADKVLEEELTDIAIDVPVQAIEQAVREVAEDTGYAVAAVRNSMMEIQDVASKSMGYLLKSKDGYENVIIVVAKNSIVPASGEKVFLTSVAGQKGIQFRLVETEEEDEWVTVESTQEIGKAWVHLPEGLPPRTPLKIHFSLNKEGRLHMTVTEGHQGRRKDFVIKTSSVLEGDELAVAKGRRDGLSVR
ncbi:MAG: Hsp70 family protein [Thermodesulfobacteriota bacterium]